MERSDEDATTYGPWPWIAGFAGAAVFMGLMFGLATGFL